MRQMREFFLNSRVAIRTRMRQWRRKRLATRRARSKQTLGLVVGLLVLAAAFAGCLSFLTPHPAGRHTTLDKVRGYAAAHKVVSVTLADQDSQLSARVITDNTSAPTLVWTAYPHSDAETAALLDTFDAAGARVNIDQQGAKANVRIVATYILPLLILADVFALLFTTGKGGSSGIGEVELFGSIGGGGQRRRKHHISFADVAGADEAVAELREVRDYLADPERYRQIGARPPKGVLLIGPPGCGKTLLAKAVAGEVGVPFFSVAGAEFVESLVGVGAARVRDLFARVRAVAPAIVFIDELDAAGRKRGHGGGEGGSDEREQTLNQILVEMDGFDVSAGIVVIGATNRPDILDPALLRPGRFDRHITIERPDCAGRARILALHAAGVPLAFDVDLEALARRTAGFSGADLANLVNEAALLAARAGKVEIEMPDFEDAVQRVLSGSVRQVRSLGAEERKRASVHESGHVIVAAATGRADRIQRVSILGRENVIATTTLRTEETEYLTETQLRGHLTLLLGGRAAERLVFGEASTGAERDLLQATEIARDIVARYGLSASIGPVRLLAPEIDEFLDSDTPLATLSAGTHQLIDDEIRRLLEDAETQATSLLAEHRASLDALSERLEAAETLEESDLAPMMAAVSPRLSLLGIGKARANGRASLAGAGDLS